MASASMSMALKGALKEYRPSTERMSSAPQLSGDHRTSSYQVLLTKIVQKVHSNLLLMTLAASKLEIIRTTSGFACSWQPICFQDIPTDIQ